MARNDIVDVAGAPRYIVGPAPETAVCVDGVDPFGEESAFRTILFALLPLGFKHQHMAGSQPNEKIGTVLAHYAAVDV